MPFLTLLRLWYQPTKWIASPKSLRRADQRPVARWYSSQVPSSACA